jgi:hypothetical protein
VTGIPIPETRFQARRKSGERPDATALTHNGCMKVPFARPFPITPISSPKLPIFNSGDIVFSALYCGVYQTTCEEP